MTAATDENQVLIPGNSQVQFLELLLRVVSPSEVKKNQQQGTVDHAGQGPSSGLRMATRAAPRVTRSETWTLYT